MIGSHCFAARMEGLKDENGVIPDHETRGRGSDMTSLLLVKIRCNVIQGQRNPFSSNFIFS